MPRVLMRNVQDFGRALMHLHRQGLRAITVVSLTYGLSIGCSGGGTGPEEPDVGTIEGTVVLDGEGGLEGVRVRLRRPESLLFATTDAQGLYSAEVSSDTWTVSFIDSDSYVGGADSVTVFVPPQESITIEPFNVTRKVYDVEIRAGDIRPEVTRIGVGAMVRWTNRDTDSHDVSFLPLGDPTSDELTSDEQFEWIFDTAGTYAFRCRLHDGETGFVIVE